MTSDVSWPGGAMLRSPIFRPSSETLAFVPVQEETNAIISIARAGGEEWADG